MEHTLFSTPYDTAPFSRFNPEDYRPAIEEAITESLSEIDCITNNPQQPTFENTIEALAFSGEKLERLVAMFFNINSAETNDVIQKEAQIISPKISEYSNDVRLNKPLFERIKTVYHNSKNTTLSSEQKMLLYKTYQTFVRNGANLSDDEKQQLRDIDKELSSLSLRYGENVLAETQNFQMLLTDEKDLKGLPSYAIEVAAQQAENKKMKGWLFTLDYPSYIPFITYADNRELRKKIFIANLSKAFKNNHFDNQENVKKIATLRYQRARLLGYQSHAEFVLEERMAKNPETVISFLDNLLKKAKPIAQQQLDELKKFAFEKDKITDFQKWDTAYYAEKLKQERFDIDDEMLKPYFQLEKVLEGIFKIAGKLYKLHFKKINNIDTYHEEVETYLVTDDCNQEVAIFYTDFHPRPGKRNGAWMTSYKNQYKRNGQNSRPHVSIVCNFTRPTKTTPSLLTFNEVKTLFHEFGHALHGMLADTIYPTLSGTNVYWDFVELPSQIMENWCFEQQALSLFAHHYQTKEVIPMEMIAKIKEAATFMEGLQTLRQLSFGLLDMAWHTQKSTITEEIQNFEKQAIEETELYPAIEGVCISTSFSHIFQGGYSAGYYSYKWAEVLEADAFEVFQQKGIFDEETAEKFKESILSKGGSEPPMDLYVRFRGQQPSSEALLKRAGLSK